MSLLHKLLAELTRMPSVTPEDAGCQPFMLDFLQQLGFSCQRFNNPPVANFFARIGVNPPLLVFAGHTDVVATGNEKQWHTPPFELTQKGDMLYGRGVADMKGSLAAMMQAVSRFINEHPTFSGSIGFLITSGEEGDHFAQGTPFVMQALQQQKSIIDYCIVGEPSSTHTVGDVLKIGRRGSLTGKVRLQGKQGHVAYPHLASNPIHTISPLLAELTNTIWDEGTPYFPPTSLQITHIQAGYANNIIPGELILTFNFRFCPKQTATSLQQAVNHCFAKHGIRPSIEWLLSGEPFLTAQGKLLQSCLDAIATMTGKQPSLSTDGGTSDGRFIAPYGVEVVELGPVNATIHQVNECVSLASLETLSHIYYEICKRLVNFSDSRLLER